MEWVNKIDLGEYETHKEALDNSLFIIKQWCEKNGYEFELQHNTYVGGTGKEHTNLNRVVFIKKHTNTKYMCYGYKLIISYYRRVIGYEEKIVGLLKKPRKEPVFEENRTWYGRLERVF